MPEDDNTIITRFIVEGEAAIQKMIEIRKISESVQFQLAELATRGKASFREMGDAMIKVKEEALKLSKTELSGLEGDPKKLAETRKQRTSELREYTKEVNKAVRDLEKLDREYFKKQELVAKQASKVRQTEAKLAGKAERDAIKQAQAAHREYVKVTQQGFGVMSARARVYGKTIQNLKNQILTTAKESGKSWQQVAREMQQAGVPAQQINQALKELNTTTKETQGGLRGLINGFKSLGGVAALIGSVVGVSLVQFFRQLIDLAGEVINRGKEMQEIFFTFEVAIRGLQRAGVDTTIASWNKQLATLKKQFPIFTRREFAESASLAALMTREFGFTEQQIAGVVQQAALLAELTGRDLLESVRGITFAIGSGYFESLQRAGINISRQVVANEALAQGYEGVYNELEPLIRAQVTYSVIQKNLSALQDDAGRKIETFAGQVLNLKRAWNDLLDTLGEATSRSEGLTSALSEVARVLDTIKDLIDSLSKLGVDPLKILSTILTTTVFGESAAKNFEEMRSVLLALNVILRNFNEILSEGEIKVSLFGREVIFTFEAIKSIFGDIEQAAEKATQKFTFGEGFFTKDEIQAIEDASKDLAESIDEIDEEAARRNIEIWSDWSKDRTDIWEDHIERLTDLESDLANKISDIDLKERRKIDDEVANNAFRVAEAIRQAAFRREDAERKFRERELSSERKFQEKLRQLRENFLLSLEDAVRDRDARQIIRLTRQFNLRRKQMVREEKLNKDDRTNQFQEELRQIERQKQERLRQFAIENERRLADIARQAERERAQAQLDFERRRDDEKARVLEEQSERNARRDEQLKDLEEDHQERYDALFESLQEEHDLTDEQLLAIGDLWERTYGQNGRVDTAIQNTINRVAELMVWMNTLRALQQSMKFANVPPGGYLGPPPDNAGGQAEGGTIIAKRPTVALFGEAGPEMATFTPLNKLGSQSESRMTPMDVGMSKDGRIRLELLLSPDLEGRIIDNTLGEMADINFAIERARK